MKCKNDIMRALSILERHRQKLIKSGSTFFLTKAVAFLAPLLLIKQVSLAEFGFIEFCFATGSILSRFVSLGQSSSYPYFILRRNEREKESFFFVFPFVMLLGDILFLLLWLVGAISQKIELSALITFVISLQLLYSTVLKSNDKSFIGVLFDGGYYYSLALFLILTVFSKSVGVNALIVILCLYSFALCIGGCLYYRRIEKRSPLLVLRDSYKEILKYGVITSVSGALMYLMTSCSRVFIEQFMGYEKVGEFSVYFRYMGITQAVFSFLYITFFKKLYMLDEKGLDKYYSIVFVLIFAICLCSLPFAPFVIHYLSHEIHVINYGILLILAFYMPIWAVLSYVEGISYRENRTMKVIAFLIVMISAFLIILYAFRHSLNLLLYTFLFVFAVGCLLLLMMHDLKKVQINLAKTRWLAVSFIIAICITYAIFNNI